MFLSRLLNCCLYLRRVAWGTAQSEGAVFGEASAREAGEEEAELREEGRSQSRRGVVCVLR